MANPYNLPDRFSVYAETLGQAKFITEKQKEFFGQSVRYRPRFYYRFCFDMPDCGYGKADQSYLYGTVNITTEYTFEQFKAFFEGEVVEGLGEKESAILQSFEEYFKYATPEEISAEVEKINQLYGSPKTKQPQQPQYVPYQCCPVCSGSGRIPSMGTATQGVCPTCNGARIIPMHVIK